MTDDNHTKLIPLTQGKFAIVDADDYDYLMQWKWYYKKGYAVRSLRIIKKYTTIHMHRVINKTPLELLTDHINRNKIDNRKCNLRSCDNRENARNQKARIYSKYSKYKGVTFHKKHNIWIAQIQFNKKKIHLGVFKNELEAAIAYNKKAVELFGEFVNLNIIEV